MLLDGGRIECETTGPEEGPCPGKGRLQGQLVVGPNQGP